MAVGSFSAGLSGLNANAQALSVIGNNLANINTVGYKASAVSFQDLVSQNIGGASINPTQVGLGVGIGMVSPIFSQGAIESSRMATHVAVQGNGFFVLEGANGRSYTRAGNFSFNSDGALITPDGQFVQGYTQVDPLTGQLITSGTTTPIIVPPGVMRPPSPSTTFQAVTNLDADTAVGGTYATAIQIYDALGSAHVMTMTYTNTGPGAWTYALTAEGAEVSGGTPGTPSSLAAGALTFNSAGVLTAPAADVAIVTPAWSNGAAASNLTWDILSGTTTTPTLTGYATASATSSITQNGAPAGMITDISIDPTGKINATFGAGQSVVMGQLAMASFNNPQGLVKLGANRYGESQASGLSNVGLAGTGGRGTLVGNALEQSNVDMAQEFTQMILAQRGYQANSKTITVSDQLLVDAINLKQ
ncbi:MAG: flagellar hook protein FlgE [Acidobacteria bacterium]|nr:flagellar hook protein FlgE [Acidobacteriota bacterium]